MEFLSDREQTRKDAAPAGPPFPQEPTDPMQSPLQHVEQLQPWQTAPRQPSNLQPPLQPIDEDLFQLQPQEGMAARSNGFAQAGAPAAAAPADARDVWQANNRVRLSEQQKMESEGKRKARERAAEVLQQKAQARAAKKEERHRHIIAEAQACSRSFRASQGVSGFGGMQGWLKVSELLHGPVTGDVKQIVSTEGSACLEGEGHEAAPSMLVASGAVKDVSRMRNVLMSLSREQQQGVRGR